MDVFVQVMGNEKSLSPATMVSPERGERTLSSGVAVRKIVRGQSVG